jgi:hypothetical protein
MSLWVVLNFKNLSNAYNQKLKGYFSHILKKIPKQFFETMGQA